MKLLVGLGNPGNEYERTRHNVGFEVINTLADSLVIKFSEPARAKAEVGEGTYKGTKLLLVKPQTFMNRVGEAVGSLLNYYKLEPKDIWVVSDDLALPLGRLRIRHRGRSGGHNGLDSIIQSLETDDFTRIRVGIEPTAGRAKQADQAESQLDAAKFVLEPFSKREQPVIKQVIDETVILILEGLPEGQLAAHTYECSPVRTII